MLQSMPGIIGRRTEKECVCVCVCVGRGWKQNRQMTAIHRRLLVYSYVVTYKSGAPTVYIMSKLLPNFASSFVHLPFSKTLSLIKIHGNVTYRSHQSGVGSSPVSSVASCTALQNGGF